MDIEEDMTVPWQLLLCWLWGPRHFWAWSCGVFRAFVLETTVSTFKVE